MLIKLLIRIIVNWIINDILDISVYSSLGLKSDQIFTIGKPSRRQSNLQVSWISNGYAEHLAYLTSPGGSRPAQGNARMVIPKGTTFQ